MTLAALIILDETRPTALLLGLSWPEFQARRAVRAGAVHIVIVADRITRDVVEAVDRLRGDGISTTLARTTAEVADLFHPEEAVLLMTGGAIVDQNRLGALLAAPGPAILCVAAENAASRHELIDASSHWTGHARIDGAQIRANGPLAGDWDLGSTLMRQAVAAGAPRTTLGVDDVLIDALSAAGVAQAARALAVPDDDEPAGWGARWGIAPLARLVVRNLPVMLPQLVRFGPSAAVLLFASGPVVQGLTWTVAAVALFLAGVVVMTASRFASVATGLQLPGRRIVIGVRDAAGCVLLLMFGSANLPDGTLLVLGVAVIAVTGLLDRLEPHARAADRLWLADRAGHAAILCGAASIGSVGLLIGLSLCAAHGLISLAVLQHRLSRVLTSID